MIDAHIEEAAPTPAKPEWKYEWFSWLLINVYFAVTGVLWLADEDRIMRVVGGLTATFGAVTFGQMIATQMTGRPPNPHLRTAMIGLIGVVICGMSYGLVVSVISLIKSPSGGTPG